MSSTALAANAEILLHAGKDEVCPCVKQKFLKSHKTFPPFLFSENVPRVVLRRCSSFAPNWRWLFLVVKPRETNWERLKSCAWPFHYPAKLSFTTFCFIRAHKCFPGLNGRELSVTSHFVFRLALYREQKWLEEKKQVLLAANDHIERLRVEKEKYSEHKWVWRQCGTKWKETFKVPRRPGKYRTWFMNFPGLNRCGKKKSFIPGIFPISLTKLNRDPSITPLIFLYVKF